jgi:hypothetical protein
MAFCKHCGSKLEDGAKFCPECGKPTNGEVDTPKSDGNDKNNEDAKNTKIGCISLIVIMLIIGYIFNKCSGGDDSNATDEAPTEQVVQENTVPAKAMALEEDTKDVSSDYFENGYEYSASFRVNREKGYGLSASYKYNLKIYNDGTTEIVEEIKGDEFPGHPSELYNCRIDKKSESYRDVSASWYEVKFNNNSMLYVDNDGNIIILRVNGNDKTIQEAITSGDCRFGKFIKKKLDSSKKYICKTCGKEYNPEKQAIVSEEYCYEDYPQTCSTCGKTYTIRTDKEGDYGSCKGTCSSCFEKYENKKIYERVTGRTY